MGHVCRTPRVFGTLCTPVGSIDGMSTERTSPQRTASLVCCGESKKKQKNTNGVLEKGEPHTGSAIDGL